MRNGMYFEVQRYMGDPLKVFRDSEESVQFDCAESARHWARDAMGSGYSVTFLARLGGAWYDELPGDDELVCIMCASCGEPCNEATEHHVETELGMVWDDNECRYIEPALAI